MSNQVSLKRELSLPLLTFYGLGTILGAGIYVLIGEVAGTAGRHAPMAFGMAAIIAGFTAFSYAELSSRYPHSAGEAVYLLEAFQRPWLAGFAGWAVAVIGAVSAATIANGFVGYFALYVESPAWLVITSLVLALGALAAWGISQSAWVATFITLLELFGLVLVVVAGIRHLSEAPKLWQILTPPPSTDVWLSITLGAFLAFYAFIGFEDMVNVAEEVKSPEHTMPKAIVLALMTATTLYILVGVVAVTSLPVGVLAVSDAPLARIVEGSGINARTSIGVIGLVAVVNGALIQIIMASRVLYGMGQRHMAPRWLCSVHPRTRTPLPATLAVTLTILTLALWLPLVTLAKTTSFVTLIVFALVNLSLVRVKRRTPRTLSAVHYPLWVPVTGFILCVGMLLSQTVF